MCVCVCVWNLFVCLVEVPEGFRPTKASPKEKNPPVNHPLIMQKEKNETLAPPTQLSLSFQEREMSPLSIPEHPWTSLSIFKPPEHPAWPSITADVSKEASWRMRKRCGNTGAIERGRGGGETTTLPSPATPRNQIAPHPPTQSERKKQHSNNIQKWTVVG